jgi:hypothetical protein
MTGDPFAVVKECKGAALSILVLLATNHQLEGGAVTQEWLERHSGYSDKTVSQALAYLQETRRILQTSVGWLLADGLTWDDEDSDRPSDAAPGLDFPSAGGSDQAVAPGAQPEGSAPLGKPPDPASQGADGSEPAAGRGAQPVHSTSAGKNPVPGPQGTGGPERPPERGASRWRSVRASKSSPSRPAPPVPRRAVSRNISDSPATTSAIDPGIIKKEAVEDGGVGIFPTPLNLEHVEANLAAFKKWGVGRNEKTIVLSARPQVTPQHIEAMARRLVGEKRFSTGLLITVVQSGDPPALNLPNKYAPPAKARDPGEYTKWEE